MKINDKLTMKTESGDTVELTVTDYKEAEFQFSHGEAYWYTNSDGGVHEHVWESEESDIASYEIGNIYKTKEKAEHAMEVQKARVRLQRKADFEPDWGDLHQFKYYAEYSHLYNKVSCNWSEEHQMAGVIYFPSRKAVEQSIKEDEADWKLVLGVE